VLELVLRIGFSLLVVFGIMWTLAKVIRRPLASRAAGVVGVLARQQLSRNASVAVVRIADRAIILGVTDNHVTLLGESDVASLERPHDHAVARVARREPLALGHAATPADAPHAEPVAPASASGGPLAGSLLSPRTWVHTVAFLRERTARH